MHAEARRIKERVQYEKEINDARLRRLFSDPPECLEEDEEEEGEEVLFMQDDPDEWWRDLQDGKAMRPEAQDICRKKDLTALEATEELLNTYRPIRESVEELRRLLSAKADPNAPPPEDKKTPLRYVMSFAPADKVDAMRALLLEYGAKESEDDRDRWQIRKEADHHELHATKTFYEDDRHLSPIAAAAERS